MSEKVPANTFLRFCHTLQAVSRTRSTDSKIALFAGYLRRLQTDMDVELACRFAGEGAFSSVSRRRSGLSHRTVGISAAAYCGIDYDLVFKPCRKATGSSSETTERLMANLDDVRRKQRPAMLTLNQVEQEYVRLGRLKNSGAKQAMLHEVWTRMAPLEVKYFIRILDQGSLKIGFESQDITAAIAAAFGAGTGEVRFVHMITGSLGNTGVLACTGKLDAAGFRMFHPLPFMHATPAGRLTAVNLPEYIAEEKFDGMRCQIHISGGDAVLFSREHYDISSSFPDIISIFSGKKMPDTVMDGVLCIFRDKTIQPCGQLQKRINRKKPSAEVLEQHPVIFIAFDVMYTAGRVVFELPLAQRRLLLEQISEEHGIFITRQYEIGNREDADRLFSEARARGNDGLMLKKQGSPYEFGQRNKSWLKVIKPGGSIDAVIMYATAGSGKRGGTCTEFTMGVSVKDDERYEEEFIPIGKISGGFSVDELEKLNSAIKPLIADRFGPTLSLLPGIMAEIEFDTIQVNKRTKAGYTLRHPRLTDIRRDPGPADAATLRDVEVLYETLANTARLPQGENASFICCRK